MNTKV